MQRHVVIIMMVLRVLTMMLVLIHGSWTCSPKRSPKRNQCQGTALDYDEANLSSEDLALEWLESKLDCDLELDQILLLAVRQGYPRVIGLLLDKGAYINAQDKEGMLFSYGETPFEIAAKTGNLEVITLLIENGADIDAKNMYEYGSTPALLYAASYNELEVLLS